MKKLSVFLSLTLIVIFALFALGSGEEATTKNQGEGSAVSAEVNDASLGKYEVEIQSCRLAKDYSGKDVVIVKYLFTNVSDENAASFSGSLIDKVYQNGIELSGSYFLEDGANYSSDNQTKDIKKGISLEVEAAYELEDTTSDIEVEVQEIFSFDDVTITKTFTIAN